MHVDMATYKVEFLSHHYARRLRPLAHYSMGWLPLWARLAMAAPSAVNALTHLPGLDRLVKSAGGIAQERDVPPFPPMRFTTWFRRLEARGELPRGDGARGPVLLWPDTFTNHLHPWIGVAATEVLEAAGFHVRIPEAELCCGLTWISTGQLTTARRVLRRTARALSGDLAEGVPVVGLEPSCTAVFRSDARNCSERTATCSGSRPRPSPSRSCCSTAPATGSPPGARPGRAAQAGAGADALPPARRPG